MTVANGNVRSSRQRRSTHDVTNGSMHFDDFGGTGLVHVPVLHPYGTFKLCWNFLGLAMIVYDALLLPMQVFDIAYTGAFLLVEWAGTIFWTLDLAFNFRTAFYEQKQLEIDGWKIAVRYAKTWLAIDLVTVAVEWLGRFLDVAGSATVMRTSRVFKAMRFFKLARLAKMQRLWVVICDSVNSSVLKLCMSMTAMTIVLAFSIHIICCAWYAVGTSTADGWTSYDAYEGHKSVPFWYLASTRWVISQINGRTDMDHNRNVQERAFTCFIGIVMAVVAKSFFTSLITKSMLDLSELTSERTKRNLMVNDYLGSNTVNLRTSSDVKRFMANYQDPDQEQKLENQVHAFLPVHLQKELFFQVRSPSLLGHDLFGTIASENHLAFRNICYSAVRLSAVGECEKVFDVGDTCSRLMFIHKGVASYETPSGTMGLDATPPSIVEASGNMSLYSLESSQSRAVGPGMWLCEPALWVNWHNKGKLVAESYMCFHTIEAADLAALLRADVHEYALVVLYAKKFIEVLGNKAYLSDIVDFQVRAEIGQPESRRLRVTLRRAAGLDGAGTGTDTYCVCQVLGLQKQTNQTRFETKVVQNCQDPVWDHSSVIHHLHPDQPLQFQVWDSRYFPIPDQLLGTARLKSSDFIADGFEGQLRLCGGRGAASLSVSVEVLA